MEGSTQSVTWMISVLMILGAAVLLLGLGFFKRWQYGKEIGPSKKHPNGMLRAEFHSHTGSRTVELLPISANGIEIKREIGDGRDYRCPRYFFNKNKVESVAYPDKPFMGLQLLQVKVPTVQWVENDPEPIDPVWERRATVATAALIGATRDEDFAAFALAADKQIHDLQVQLANALSRSVQPMFIYLGLAAAVGASVYAAWSIKNVGDSIKLIMATLGIAE